MKGKIKSKKILPKVDEEMIEKVIKVLKIKFCETIVKRIICVILLAFEMDKKIILEKLGLSERSIKKYAGMLESGQINELVTIKRNSRKSELEDYREEILGELESGEYKTLRQIKAMIKAKTGLVRSRYRISMFLKKRISSNKGRVYTVKGKPGETT